MGRTDPAIRTKSEDTWGARDSGRLGDGDGERQPFLAGNSSGALPTVSPVRLTPGWEDSLPNRGVDDFQLRNSTVNLAQPPKDRFKLVFLIMVIHGVGTLIPWNMFITAKSYFVDYKFGEEAVPDPFYRSNFMNAISFASQIPNVLFNWLNIFVPLGGNLKTRIVLSIIVEVILFIGTIILAMVDTSSWPQIFFALTILTVVVLNMAGGIYQNSIYGIAAKLDYSGAVVLGSNISGTFASIISLVSLWMAPDPRTAAIYYFITALFALLVCFDTYFALPLNKFYRYHELLSSKEKESKRQVSSRPGLQRTSHFAILKKCFPQCLNVFLIFFVTLSIFPGVHSDIQMSDPSFIIPKKYFIGVTCFLTFNLSAMLGNMVPSLFQWPSPKYLWIPVVLRFFFVPFYLFCNYLPIGYERTLPILITNDWVYWGGAVLLGLTSGYYSSLAMMYCPRTVESEHAPVAGMFGAAFLITGIFAGICFSFVMPYIVSSPYLSFNL